MNTESERAIDAKAVMSLIREKTASRGKIAPPEAFPTRLGELPPLERTRLPALPTLYVSEGEESRDRLDALIKDALRKTEVDRRIPKLLRRFFRKQGGFNKLLLEIGRRLVRSDSRLYRKNADLVAYLTAQNDWLRASVHDRELDHRWLRSFVSILNKVEVRISALEAGLQLVEGRSRELDLATVEISRQVSASKSDIVSLTGRLTDCQNEAIVTTTDLGAMKEQFADHQVQTSVIIQDLNILNEQMRIQGKDRQDIEWLRQALLAEIKAREAVESEQIRSREKDRQDIEWLRQALLAEIKAREAVESKQMRSREKDRQDIEWLRQALSAEIKAREAIEDQRGTAVELSYLKAVVEQLQTMQGNISERQLTDSSFLKGELHLIARNFASLVEKSSRAKSPKRPENAPAVSVPDQHAFDAFYVAFENQFRGARELIKKRGESYLPDLARARVGTPKSPILDLGCGRGEWLELLKEKGLIAEGVDSNLFMVAECQERDLAATEDDALAFLKSKRKGSLGAVTGFHIIEHLPFPVLMDVVREVFRVLRPGGLAIFETPNPDNVLVGSNRFYSDPTHLRPLPKEFASFVLSSAGLRDVQIRTLHPDENSFDAGKEAPRVQLFINQMFFGNQDYAVIARK